MPTLNKIGRVRSPYPIETNDQGFIIVAPNEYDIVQPIAPMEYPTPTLTQILQQILTPTTTNYQEPVIIPINPLPAPTTTTTTTNDPVKIDAANCSCLHGTPYIEEGICKCTSGVIQTTAPNTGNNPTPTNAPVITGNPLTDIINKVKANPLPFLIGGAAVFYLATKK
jgi:hypothetical protein